MATFDGYKAGDKVWHITKGWVTIDIIIDNPTYPICIQGCVYSLDGKACETYTNPTIFPNKFQIPEEAYKKPLPDLKVDDKVIVWNHKEEKKKRHFSHFDRDGNIYTFPSGETSWSTNSKPIYWIDYEIPKDDKC